MGKTVTGVVLAGLLAGPAVRLEAAELKAVREKDKITVTAAGRFEAVFRDYHGGIADWHDLKNDPKRERSLCSATDVPIPSPLHHALLWMKLAPADRELGGPYHPAPALRTELLEKGPARVRIRQTGKHSKYGKGTIALDRINFERVWTIYPSGQIYHRYDVINTGESFKIRGLNVVLHTTDLWRGTRTKVPGTRRPTYDETTREVRVDADETGHSTFETRPQKTGLMLQWSDGPKYFADCLVAARTGRYGVAYWAVPGPYDWRTSLGVADVFPDRTIPKGTTTLHFLMQISDDINGVAAACERADDYRNPARLTMTRGKFVESEGHYVLESADGVAFTLVSPKHKRFTPAFEIRNWPAVKDVRVTMNGTALKSGVDYVTQSSAGVCVVQLTRVLAPGTVTLTMTPV